MPRRVVEVNSIEEAFCQGKCPHCALDRPDKKQNITPSTPNDTNVLEPPPEAKPKRRRKSTGDWLDNHLKRCKGIPLDLEAAEKIKASSRKWVLHEDCGRVMLLDVEGGLALIENQARRYVVPCRDITFGKVANVLELIEANDITNVEIRELISHLLAKVGEVSIIPAIHAGSRVEFKCGDNIKRGRVERRHGKNAFIIKTDDGNGINVGKDSIIHVIE